MDKGNARRELLRALLAQEEVATTAELARRLQVSRRTLFRYIAQLREEGADIDADRGRGGGVRLLSGGGMRRIALAEAQFLRLLISLVVVEKMGLPFFQKGKGAIPPLLLDGVPHSKVRGFARLKRRVLIGANAPDALLAAFRPPLPGILPPLEEAFMNARRLHIAYVDEKGRRTARDIEPHGLIVHWPLWYILAFDHLRGAARTFRIDRVRQASLRDERFGERAQALFEEIGGAEFAAPL